MKNENDRVFYIPNPNPNLDLRESYKYLESVGTINLDTLIKIREIIETQIFIDPFIMDDLQKEQLEFNF